MQGAPSTQDDIRAEQDRVAALADKAAVDAGGQVGQAATAAPAMTLTHGPALTPDVLTSGILRLARDLKGAEQTSPAFVEQVFGAALGPDDTGKRSGARGVFGAGTYVIEVETLYPGTPGQHVSVLLDAAKSKPCGLDYVRIVEQLEDAGYRGKRAPRGMDPSMNFSKDLGTMRGFVQLDIDGYDAPCIWQVSFDLENHGG